jgi:hypothetical protein
MGADSRTGRAPIRGSTTRPPVTGSTVLDAAPA